MEIMVINVTDGTTTGTTWDGATTATCRECKRKFDLTKTADAAEWTYGHDCEA